MNEQYRFAYARLPHDNLSEEVWSPKFFVPLSIFLRLSIVVLSIGLR